MQNEQNQITPEFQRYHADAFEICRQALGRVGANDDVGRAVGQLAKRIRLSIDSIWILTKSGHAGYEDDAVSLLRGIYDAQLQALYAIRHPEHAARYHDFFYVDRARLASILERLALAGSRLGISIMNSPARSDREPIYQQEFDRVRAQFIDPRKASKPRTNPDASLADLSVHWYAGTLKGIAREEDPCYDLEYDLVMHQSCSVLHSSSFGANCNSHSGASANIYAWHFLHRVMHRALGHFKATVPEATNRTFLVGSNLPIYALYEGVAAIRS